MDDVSDGRDVFQRYSTDHELVRNFMFELKYNTQKTLGYISIYGMDNLSPTFKKAVDYAIETGSLNQKEIDDKQHEYEEFKNRTKEEALSSSLGFPV